VDLGTTGRVVSVRRISKGASVVMHFTGPAAESALQLRLAAVARLTEAP
jgi:hypothetical protein